jgi:hypothetical protein
MSNCKYTADMALWLRCAAPVYDDLTELTEAFNRQYGTDYTPMSVDYAMTNRHIRTYRDARFKPGESRYRPPKGTHGSPKTEFKPGHRPGNWRPVGSERINIEGYIEVKTAEPRTWRLKHRVVWEAAHGPIPAGHLIIFADGNRQNCTLDNLVCISNRQNLILNHKNIHGADLESVRTAALIADVIHAASAARKRPKGDQNA